VERRKVLIFETTRTLMRAFELAFRCSPWTIVKVQQEGRLFPSIESSSPDVLIVERRALSPEVKEGLTALPLPVIYCAKEKSNDPNEHLFLPRPFSCDELFATLDAALAWTPDLVMAETPVENKEETELLEEEEEPLVLTSPDDEEGDGNVFPLTEETGESDLEPLATIEEGMNALETSSPEKETHETPQEETSPPLPVTPLASDTNRRASSVVVQVSEQVEQRVSEELTLSGTSFDEGPAIPETIRTLIRRELREVMKEYFWEEAPHIVREVLEEEIRKLAAKT